jgi:hypothetical protein
MMITCSKCPTTCRTETYALGAANHLVRCACCRNVKFVRDPSALPAIAKAYRAEVETFCASLSILQLAEVSITERPPSTTSRD